MKRSRVLSRVTQSWLLGTLLILGVSIGCSEKLVRHDSVSQLHAMRGLTITVTPSEAEVGWFVRILNSRRTPVFVLWDQSTYVSTNGETRGRLIRGFTRIRDSALPQPPSPIPTGAALLTYCVPEAHLDQPKDGKRLLVANPQSTGRLVLAIEGEDGTEYWEGTVNFPKSQTENQSNVKSGLKSERPAVHDRFRDF